MSNEKCGLQSAVQTLFLLSIQEGKPPAGLHLRLRARSTLINTPIGAGLSMCMGAAGIAGEYEGATRSQRGRRACLTVATDRNGGGLTIFRSSLSREGGVWWVKNETPRY